MLNLLRLSRVLNPSRLKGALQHTVTRNIVLKPCHGRPTSPARLSTKRLQFHSKVLNVEENAAANSDADEQGKIKSSMMFTIKDTPGSLQNALQIFWKHDVNLTRLESRPNSFSSDFDFYVCFEGTYEDVRIQKLMTDLKKQCVQVLPTSSAAVPWFPTRIQDLDEFANDTLDAGEDLQADHPGFKDHEYRQRRELLADVARNHRHGKPIPHIDYTETELQTWSTVYNKLIPLIKQNACKEHISQMPKLEKNCGYDTNNIPQLNDISNYLTQETGFVLRPVCGLLSARHFLYGLAFRVFFSTQYIRHYSKPLYTPEPDICHELLGHAPLFADKKFADFSQEIGLASIGATDDQILRLARCYWFSVEFGLCKEDGKRKAYGAGLLSSFGELEYSMSDEPEVRPWDPFNAADQDYPITTYQPIYYIADNFEDAKMKMKEFSCSFARPFSVRYNAHKKTMEVDRNIERLKPKH